MPDTFDFEEEYESEVSTLDGARPQAPLDEAAASRRRLYTTHRQMTTVDGAPIITEEPAQMKLEREARQARALELRRQAHEKAQQRHAEEATMESYAEANEFEEALDAEVQERRTVQETLSEAELRFEKAKYYRLIITQPLIQDPSEVGQEVLKEIQDFAQERFEIFLGMRQERPTTPVLPPMFQDWRPEDYQTLLTIVRRIQAKPELAQTTRPAAEPTLTPAQAAPAAEPQVRPVSMAAPAPQPAPRPAPRPAPAKAPPPAAPRLAIKAQPRPKPPQPPGAATAGPRKRILRPLVNPQNGEKVMDPVTGRQLTRDETPQVMPLPSSPHQPVPMPMDSASIEMMHANKAQEGANLIQTALQKAGKAGIKLRTAIAYSQLTGSDEQVVYEGSHHVHDPRSSIIEPGDMG